MEIVSNVFYLIANFIYELLLFVVVDGAVKFLQNTRSTDAKEMIWRFECVVLFVAVIYVWWMYHMPYFLVFMLTLAVWSTQTTLTANMRRWWLLVLARWEEFEQHEESMGQMQQQQQFPDDVVNNAVKPRPPLSAHQDSPPAVEIGQRPSAVQRRPALHGSVVTSIYASPPVQTSHTGISVGQKGHGQHWLKQMTNRAHVAISSVLGQSVRRYDDLTPPGLRNPNQNVCFLNSIIQAIAHTPCLPEAVTQLRKSNPQDLLVWHLNELIEHLAAPVSTDAPLILDTSNFRRQASVEFFGGLIQQPFEVPQQRQQDAAECLTWMVEWLHARMSSVSSRTAAKSSVTAVSEQRNGLSPDSAPHRSYYTMTVSRLMQKYDVQSRQTTIDQRSAAISQIESSDGMNTSLYIGSLNTVSQIDWYWQCRSSRSAVNELFAGQLVDLRLCDSCRRVAVTTQLFHILTVPVAEPQLLHGLVSLDACLQQFAQIEQLGGANGLMCDHCNQLRSLHPDPVVAVTVTPVGNHVVPLSPICSSSGLLNDSVGREFQQRTSTPIQSQLRLPASSVLTDCRRRSLIGYLPSCLVIQLMRFVVDAGRQSAKLSLPVTVPLSGLDLSPYILHNVDPAEAGLCERSVDRYNLYAVCVHVGSDSTTNGHYITYARCANDGWYCFDDEHVRAVNMDYELTTRLVRENAYLLFYERAFAV